MTQTMQLSVPLWSFAVTPNGLGLPRSGMLCTDCFEGRSTSWHSRINPKQKFANLELEVWHDLERGQTSIGMMAQCRLKQDRTRPRGPEFGNDGFGNHNCHVRDVCC